MARTKAKNQNQSFMYDSEDNKDNKASVQPTMLPPFFREKSRFVQKIYLFVLVFAISLATGITSFIMLDDFAGRYGIISGTQIAYLVMTLVMWFITIGAATLYVWWSRTRSHLFTLTGVLATAAAPLILSAALLYLDINAADPNDPEVTKNAFFVLGVTSLAAGLVIGLLILVRNLLFTKIFRDAKFRSLFTIAGLLVISASPMLLWFTAKDNNFGSFDVSQFIYSFVTMFGGAILLTLGIMFSMKYKTNEVKSTTTSIKLSGSLPTIIIFTSLLAIGLRFLKLFEIQMPLIIVVVADVVLIGMFVAFLFFKARIKNIAHTNPLFNEFIIKGFTIIITTIGLIIVALLPQLISVRSYAPLAFGILAMTALSVIIVILLAHFANLIVFEKFFKSIIITSVITILLILVLVFVLGTLSQSEIIMQIVSRSLVMVLMIAAILGEVVLLMLDVMAINKDVFTTARFIKKKKKHEKHKKKDGNEGEEVEDEIEESVGA